VAVLKIPVSRSTAKSGTSPCTTKIRVSNTPGEETRDGTPFDLDEMREFRVKGQAANDDAGQRSFNAHLSPRWPGMQSVNGNDISPPKGFGDGVNVRISGSNIHFGRYLDLTQSAFESVGVNEWYFYNPEDSTLIDAERYVRIHENRSGPIHGRAGQSPD